MPDFAYEIVPVNLEDEMKQSYLDYAMSVIVGRALPDVRDGLKPVHRRILFSMHENNNVWNRPYVKCARVVGDVLGKYHPHGDAATYDALVRMAQSFSMRYMLVDGQGNFGSIDGDPPAAYRYTECRMTQLSGALLEDLDKETVDFAPNYDAREFEPTVLPTRVPNLLVNGASGIAVGMATNVPPHNLGEVISGCIALIDDPDLDLTGLMEHIPGPDFPTAAVINGAKGIREAYATGRGRVYVRARSHVEGEEGGRQTIVVTELPYQVNKARLLERIAELVKDRKVEGISELRDESDKDGMRMVIELRRAEVPEVVLNNLYQHTALQSVFGINMVGLVDGRPRILDLKQLLEAFIRHRREVVTRRTVYELRKARERAHVLEGLAVALANIDPVIAMIKASSSPAEAKAALVAHPWEPGVVTAMLSRAGAEASRPDDLSAELGLKEDGYHLSEVQAKAILDLQLHRLTSLEQDKIVDEYRELLVRIAELGEILVNPDRLMQVIREELEAVREQFGDARRTEIVVDRMDLSMEDMITEEDVVVTLSHMGYAKAQPLSAYAAQRRGGRGKVATAMKEEDFVDKLFIANTHDTVLCFSSRGRVYWLKVYELPQAGRNARGRPIVNLLPLEPGERINAVLPVKEYSSDRFVFMATASGTVKKTPLVDFSRQRASGIIAVELRGGDSLVGVAITDGKRDIMLLTSDGKAIRFRESEVRPMGRGAAGVRGIRLAPDQRVISLIIVEGEGAILTATENGYGKRTPLVEHGLQGRGGQGLIAIRTSERNGEVIGALQVGEENEIMLITDGGTLVRTRVAEISTLGRNTQGVKLISLGSDEKLCGLDRIAPMDAEPGDAGATVH
jgi:DNA gyrase subunit A